MASVGELAVKCAVGVAGAIESAIGGRSGLAGNLSGGFCDAPGCDRGCTVGVTWTANDADG